MVKMMKKSYIFAAISILIWSTSSVVIKLMLQELSGLQALFYSFAVATVFLFLIVWRQGKLGYLREYKLKDYAIIGALGFVGIFIYNMLNTYSYQFASGTQAAAINYLWPMWTIVIGAIVLGERLTAWQSGGTLLSIVGMSLVATRGDYGGFVKMSLFGIGLSFLGSILYGGFCAFVKKVSYDKTVSMMLYFAVGTVAALISVIFFSSFPALNLRIIGFALWRGIVTCGVAYLTWAIALRGDTVKISNLALITPFLQLVSLAIIFDEEIGAASILGLVLIIAGNLAATKRKA